MVGSEGRALSVQLSTFGSSVVSTPCGTGSSVIILSTNLLFPWNNRSRQNAKRARLGSQ